MITASQELDQLRKQLSTLQMKHQTSHINSKQPASSSESGIILKRQKTREVENAQRKLVNTILYMPVPSSVTNPSKLSSSIFLAKNTMAQEVYLSEMDRVNAMNESFQDIFGSLGNLNNTDGAEVNALLSTTAHGLNQKAALAIIEYKNEGSNEPTIQGSFVYTRY
ncbi:4368_t:CDS:2 [Ambispora gerdemannii]|uniref:4368_t:CDS:1 n=1 Tax=Ambispora gerdemannii TaxID=144530 RepID=A0A9N8Z031_9GLOM|nr:4368_t:CDS:2 [Ambispora gerdemannii]